MGQAFCVYYIRRNWKDSGEVKQRISAKWHLSVERDSIGTYLGFTRWYFKRI